MRTAAVVLFAIGIVWAPGCRKNHAPDTPAIPSGPTSCAVGVEYTFSSSATDPDGDSVAIRFDWGDGDTSDWSEHVPSGNSAAMSHAWSTLGTYAVRAQAKDARSAASAWSGGCTTAVLPVSPRSWTRTFGGVYDDGGSCAQQTTGGGYIVTGFKYFEGGNWDDVWLIKTNADGEAEWSRTYGGTDGDRGYSVQQTQDGGYIVTGYTDSYGPGLCDLWLIKTDAGGDTAWTRTLGGAMEDKGCSVQQTRDGGYIVAGWTGSFGAGSHDVWLIRTDVNGDTVWAKTYGGTLADEGHSVQQTSDGGFIVAGFTQSYGAGGYDVWLIKTDANGDTVWTSTFGGDQADWCNSVQQTQDGGYIIAGYAAVFHGWYSADVWLIRTDVNGDTVWTKTFGGTSWDEGYSVQQTQDGGYIVAGSTYSFGAGGRDVWVIKTGPNGEVDEDGAK